MKTRTLCRETLGGGQADAAGAAGNHCYFALKLAHDVTLRVGLVDGMKCILCRWLCKSGKIEITIHLHGQLDQLLALRTFVRIAETGSFSKAADQLNLPRSTASKLVQDLEDHLGTS
jgi:hypothetical protein